MMKPVTHVQKPGEIVFSMTISLPLKDWERVVEELDKTWCYPMSDIAEAVRAMAHDARRTFGEERGALAGEEGGE